MHSIAVTLIRHAGERITARDLQHGTNALRSMNVVEIGKLMTGFVGHGWVTPENYLPSNSAGG